MGYSRQAMVDLVASWLGKNESDGSYKSIANKKRWLYIHVAIDGVLYTGFTIESYLSKQRRIKCHT